MPVVRTSTLGTGEIERVSSPISKNNNHIDNHHHNHDEENESFVVRNFRAVTFGWLASDNTSTSTSISTSTSTTITKIATISSEEEEEEYDATTDLAYHDRSEREGSELVHQALTPEERNAMPDAFMSLRHYRAEKVCTVY